MTAPHADQLIDGYLARLRAAAVDLPQTARDELLSDMQSHIAEARSRESDETDATILNILDRLGEPSVVVAETRDRLGLRPPSQGRSGLVEIAAIVLLPTIWIAGVILLWWSTAWKTRDKVIGTIGTFGGYPFVFVLAAFFSYSPSIGGGSCVASSGPDGIVTGSCTSAPLSAVVFGIMMAALGLVLLVLPLLTSLYLAFRIWRQRKAAAVLAG
jgi:uncharacterized membrane protein